MTPAGWRFGWPTTRGASRCSTRRWPLRPWVPAIPGANQRPQGVATSWYFIAVSFDARTGRVVFTQDPLNGFPFDPTRVTTERDAATRALGVNDEPLLMAAMRQPQGGPGAHYNGKIDHPRLYGRALSPLELQTLEGKTRDRPMRWPTGISPPTFSQTSSRDRSARRLNGRTVNLPMRAVTGHNWDSSQMDYTRAPEQYGAIYFHDDDLDDAQWDVGLLVPRAGRAAERAVRGAAAGRRFRGLRPVLGAAQEGERDARAHRAC